MSQLLKCSRGHSWSAEAGSDSTQVLEGPEVCPHCGQPAVAGDAGVLCATLDTSTTDSPDLTHFASHSDATIDLPESASRKPAGQVSPGTKPTTSARWNVGTGEQTLAEPSEPAASATRRPPAEDASSATMATEGAAAEDASSVTMGLDQAQPANDATCASLGPDESLPPDQRSSATMDLADSRVIDQRNSMTLGIDQSQSGNDASSATVSPEESRLVSMAGQGTAGSSRTRVVEALAGDAPKKGQGPPTGYEMLKELGRGAMGVVYKARQVALNRLVALKMVLAGQHAGPKVLVRFQIEAEAVARLHHPNIVQIYEIGEMDGCPFFSLEYVDGGTLSERIEQGPRAPREAAAVMRQLAEAMDSAHRSGVIHRDLKPANILLAINADAVREEGKLPPLSACVPKVTDFGLAKRLEGDSSHTHAGTIMGTPSYMAPEQAEGKVDEVGPPADIYALGAILYDMLTGRPPFQGKTVLETLQQVKKLEPISPRKLVPQIPRDLDTICLKCLEKDPAKRYPSAGDLALDLQRFLKDEPIRARPVGVLERGWKWCKRSPAVAALTIVGVLIPMSLAVGGPIIAHRESQRAEREKDLKEQAEDAKQKAEEQRLVAVEQHKQAEKARKDAEDAQRKTEEQRQKTEEQRLLAVEQRKQADENFRDAQDAVNVMLTRIGQERLENEPRMEKVRRDVLESALSFYVRFLKKRSDDPVLRWQTATAYVRVGNIQRMLGQPDQAEKAYRSAQEMLRGLVKEFPANEAYRLDLTLAHSQMGELLRARDGRLSEKEYLDAIDLCQKLVEAAPKSAEYQRALSAAYSGLGVSLLEQGEQARGDKALEDGLAVQGKIVAAHPDRPEYLLDLGKSHNDHGVLMQTNNRLADSAQAYARAVDLLQPLVEKHGKVGEYQQELARAMSNRATVLQVQGKAAEAEQIFRQVKARREELATQFPNVTAYQYEKARTLFLLGTLLQSTSPSPAKPEQLAARLKEAEDLHQSALDLFRKLIDASPRDPEYRHGLTSCMNNLADLLRATNRTSDGVRMWEEAITLLDALSREFRNRTIYVDEEARALHNLGVSLSTLKKFKEAEEALKKAITLRERLGQEQKQVPSHRINQAASVGELGIVQAGSNQLEKSEASFRQAIAILQKLDQEIPNRPEIWEEEIVQQGNLAFLLKALNRDNGVKACEKRIEELKQKLPKK